MEPGQQEGIDGPICENYYFGVDGGKCEGMFLHCCPAGYEEHYTTETCPRLKEYRNAV